MGQREKAQLGGLAVLAMPLVLISFF